MRNRIALPIWMGTALVAMAMVPVRGLGQEPAEPAEGEKPAAAPKYPGPEPVPEVVLAPTLPTKPIPRGARGITGKSNIGITNYQLIDTRPFPREKQGIWVLDLAFKPLRVERVETDKGRKQVYYLYYRVINRTGKPRLFAPEFTLVTESGRRYPESNLPAAVKTIAAREDPTTPLLGVVKSTGMIPPSTQEGIDEAVFGVAIFEGVDPRADHLDIYVRGLSDGNQEVPPPDDPRGKKVVRYKTLKIPFLKVGDDREINENEIIPGDPPYQWIYW